MQAPHRLLVPPLPLFTTPGSAVVVAAVEGAGLSSADELRVSSAVLPLQLAQLPLVQLVGLATFPAPRVTPAA